MATRSVVLAETEGNRQRTAGKTDDLGVDAVRRHVLQGAARQLNFFSRDGASSAGEGTVFMVGHV